MQITKPTKAEVTRELKDYIFITLGLISYALGCHPGLYQVPELPHVADLRKA